MQRINALLDIYRITGLVQGKSALPSGFIDPLGFNKTPVRIGILSPRSKEKTRQRWAPLATHLNRLMEDYHTEIIPLTFNEIRPAIEKQQVDFAFINPLLYIQLEQLYGLSRIATYNSPNASRCPPQAEIAGVIFSLKKPGIAPELKLVARKRIAAVAPTSFAGWAIQLGALQKQGISPNRLHIDFFYSQDAVVEAVRTQDTEIGFLPSGALESMQHEGSLSLNEFYIYNEQHNTCFPFVHSTERYPEWPFAKLKHVPHETANLFAATLLNMSRENQNQSGSDWTVPLDYAPVKELMKKLGLPPYDLSSLTFKQFVTKYALGFNSVLTFILILILHAVYTYKLNLNLGKAVAERTKKLRETNSKLQKMARTDPLTGLNNRRYFMEFAEQYITLAQRNETPLHLLSLDIDHFKHINDQYGHHSGDIALQQFSKELLSLIRCSDLLGRIGGEEFSLCLQNTTGSGAKTFAEKILTTVRKISLPDSNGGTISFSVSIGIAELRKGDKLSDLMKRADHCLYQAKRQGRDRAVQETHA